METENIADLARNYYVGEVIEMCDIKVSVICLVYNHEKYLRQCLEGMVSQQTDFAYEILIHDDASTDNSALIIKEYEERYPELIRVVYQKENQYSKGRKITKDILFPMARGKYLAICEGDDYWCNDNKLFLQYHALEENTKCSLCTHKVRRIQENGEYLDSYYPINNVPRGLVTSADFIKFLCLKEAYPFQTSSYFYRKTDAPYNLEEYPQFMQDLSFGDIPLMLYLITKGNLYYIDEEMSHYRVASKGSWNSRQDKSSKKNLNENRLLFRRYDEYTKFQYSEEIEKAIRKKEFWYYTVNHQYKEMLQRRYREFFLKMTFKEKVYVLIHSFFKRREF